MGISAMMLVAVAIVVIAWTVQKNQDRSFDGHGNDLIVSSTSLERDPAKPDFWLKGVITNQSRHAWRVHRLEVRFLDKRNVLVEVRHPNVEDVFVVLPFQEHGFRARLGELAFTNNEVIRQAYVRIASDGDRPQKSD